MITHTQKKDTHNRVLLFRTIRVVRNHGKKKTHLKLNHLIGGRGGEMAGVDSLPRGVGGKEVAGKNMGSEYKYKT